MENRWGSRKPSAIEAIIDYRPRGLVRGTICDFSLSGVYIKTDTASIPLNTSVKLVFLVPDNLVTHIHRVRAQVVRQDDRGLGVTFIDIEKHTLRILQRLQAGTPGSAAVRADPGMAPAVRSGPEPAVESTNSSSS